MDMPVPLKFYQPVPVEDLLPLLRHGQDPRALAGRISQVWTRRNDRCGEVRETRAGERQKVEMYRLGG